MPRINELPRPVFAGEGRLPRRILPETPGAHTRALGYFWDGVI